MSLAEIEHDEGTTRQRLLEAAAEVFLEKGYGGTRVVDVARRAGLTTGAIYAHFENKAALLTEAVAAQGARAFAAAAETITSDLPPGQVAEDLNVRVLAGPAEPFHKLILESLAAALRDDAAAEPLLATLGRLDQANRRLIEQGRQSGGIDDSVTTDALAGFLQTLVLGGFVVKALELAQPTPEEVRMLLRRFLDGLAPS